jgi:uncharacterized protein YndB with AHSA1/START domain
MIRYSSRIVIDRPPAEVFEALIDPSRYGQWTDMVDLRFDAASPPTVGTRGRFRLAKGPIKGLLEMELVELVPSRRVVFRIDHPWLAWTATSELVPVGAGTQLTYAGEVGLRGWRRLLEPIMAGEVRNGEAGEAQRLKVVLESELGGAEAAVAST